MTVNLLASDLYYGARETALFTCFCYCTRETVLSSPDTLPFIVPSPDVGFSIPHARFGLSHARTGMSQAQTGMSHTCTCTIRHLSLIRFSLTNDSTGRNRPVHVNTQIQLTISGSDSDNVKLDSTCTFLACLTDRIA